VLGGLPNKRKELAHLERTSPRGMDAVREKEERSGVGTKRKLERAYAALKKHAVRVGCVPGRNRHQSDRLPHKRQHGDVSARLESVNAVKYRRERRGTRHSRS